MASLAAMTAFSFDKSTGVTQQTVTLSATATAGMTLVLVTAAGAVMTANLTSAGGTAFTKRVSSAATIEMSVQDAACAGGETQVVLTLSGAENVSGVIYHFTALGAFIGSCSNGTGNVPANATDNAAIPTAAITVTGNAVLAGAWGTTVTTQPWAGFGPAGHVYQNVIHSTGTGTKFSWMSGLADITAAGSWPPSLAAGSYKPYSTKPGQTVTTVNMCAAAYTDTSGVATNAAAANSTVAENALPGTAQGNWYAAGFADGTIAGFCDKMSYNPGDTVNFKVDSGSNPFRVEVYRVGFYGNELMGARNVLGYEAVAADAGFITGTATAQSAPVVDGTLGSTSCPWTANASWTIPSGAQSGLYHVIFRRTDVTTDFSSATFVVKAASAAGKACVVLPDFTWHAYNVWGATSDHGGAGATYTGRSLYGLGDQTNSHRAYAVCFDRPCITGIQNGVTHWFDAEQPLICFLEAQGYDLAYYSCVDLENDTTQTLLTQAKVVVAPGHHEYWSANVYNSLTAAANAGASFMFVSGNTGGWHTRFAAADTSKRTMICYKDSLTVDVTAGWTGTGRDPVSYTGAWRDTRTATAPNNSDFRIETALTGQHFVNGGNTAVKQQVPFASKGLPVWRNSASVQALTTGTSYTEATGTSGWSAGFELDVPDGTAGTPPGLVQLNPFATGTLTAGANLNGSVYTTSISPTASFSLYRRNASRALIFATGAWRGWWGVTRYAGGSYASSSLVSTPDVNWQNALLAVMYDLGLAPVTLSSAKPGIDTAVTDPATGAPAPAGDKTAAARAYGLRCPEDGQFMAVPA